MADVWFWIVSGMVAIYAVMDGFDFGAGALHLFVARTDAERRQVLAAIGPLWDANEVWLLAAGGALFVAFPAVLAAGFSGFYLAMFLVLWTLIGRGIAIEFRSHVDDVLWRAFWDAIFSGASVLMPVLLGAALGNVLRGVPLGADHTFELSLFTTFHPGNPVGILDWYTTLVGVFALVALSAHGAVFLAWKTRGPVHARSHQAAVPLWIGVGILWIAVTMATRRVAPEVFAGLARPVAIGCLLLVGAGVAGVVVGLRRKAHLVAFVGSAAFLLGLLATAAASTYPVLLRSTLDPAYSLTAANAASSPASLRLALGWWVVGIPLVIGYFAFLFYRHAGPVAEHDHTY